MKLFLALAVLVSILPALHAVEKISATGKILSLEQKTNTRILYYQVDTPITRDDPYYEVAVQIKDTVYRGIYTPRHSKDLLPAEWLPGAEVHLKIDDKHMILLTPSGREVDFAISHRSPAKSGDDAAPPTSKK